MTEPLTPPDCDLRGLPFMPLDVVRLVDSDLVALATGDEFKAAVVLWCKSWLQLPAASLPNDDRILAHLSGAGSRWPRLRAVALRGWIECSDGRLYHPVVAEKAREAWSFRLRQRERSARANAVRWASSPASPRGSNGHPHGDPKGQGQGQEKKDKPSSPRAASPPDWLPAAAWDDWCRYRRGKTWTPKAQELSLRELGRLREAGNDPAAVIEQSIANGWRGLFPIKHANGTSGPARPSNLAWMREGFGAPAPQPGFDLDLTAEEVP